MSDTLIYKRMTGERYGWRKLTARCVAGEFTLSLDGEPDQILRKGNGPVSRRLLRKFEFAVENNNLGVEHITDLEFEQVWAENHMAEIVSIYDVEFGEG